MAGVLLVSGGMRRGGRLPLVQVGGFVSCLVGMLGFPFGFRLELWGRNHVCKMDAWM